MTTRFTKKKVNNILEGNMPTLEEIQKLFQLECCKMNKTTKEIKKQIASEIRTSK